MAQSCVELLQAMIGFDTVNRHDRGYVGRMSNTKKLATYLEQVANGWGLSTQRLSGLSIDSDEFNLLVYVENDPDKPWLLFDSHMDTVAVEGMTIEPFAGVVEGDRIYGRGACDTKGTGAAMLWALKRFAQVSDVATKAGHHKHCQGHGNVAILFTVDEEHGKTGVRAFVDTQMHTLHWRPSAVVVGEPTQMRIVSATGGVVRWRIRTHGVAAHSSDPTQGRSAIHAMMQVIDAIEKHYIARLEAHHPLVGKACASINQIAGGSQINIIPETCDIRIDRRVVPGENPNHVISQVEAVLDTLRQRDTNLQVEQGEAFIDPPLHPRLSEAMVKHVGALLAEHDINHTASGATYGTNASTYSEAGIPAIVWGPGDIRQAHAADEWLALDQLHLGEKLYFDLMCRTCHLDVAQGAKR